MNCWTLRRRASAVVGQYQGHDQDASVPDSVYAEDEEIAQLTWDSDRNGPLIVALVNNAAYILALIEAAGRHLETHGYCYGCGAMPNHYPPNCSFPTTHAINCPFVRLKPLVEGSTT